VGTRPHQAAEAAAQAGTRPHQAAEVAAQAGTPHQAAEAAAQVGTRPSQVVRRQREDRARLLAGRRELHLLGTESSLLHPYHIFLILPLPLALLRSA
jgi:hypothetical protein